MGCDFNLNWDDGYGVTWGSPLDAWIHPRLHSGGTSQYDWSVGWMHGTNVIGTDQFQNVDYGSDSADLDPQQLADNSGEPYRQLQLIGDCTNYFIGLGSEIS